jgi:hypothetical protein
MKTNVVAIVVSIACVSSAASDLPHLDASQLASLVRAEESKLARYRVEYRTSFGRVRGNDPFTGVFEKDPAAPPREAGFAIDSQSGYRWTRYRQSSPEGSTYVKEILYDPEHGGRWANTVAPGSQVWRGTITGTQPPELFGDGGGHLRPDQFSFQGIPGYSLSDALATAKKAEVAEELFNGILCYKVALDIRGQGQATHEGRAVLGETAAVYRIWLDPARGYLPVRLDRMETSYVAYDQIQNPFSSGIFTGRIQMSRLVTEASEVQPGVWFPRQGRIVLHGAGPEPEFTASTIEILKVDVGAAANVPTSISFPTGTYVTDELAHIKYRAGPAQAGLDEVLDEAMKALKEEAPSSKTAITAPGTGTEAMGEPDSSHEHGSALPRSLPEAQIRAPVEVVWLIVAGCGLLGMIGCALAIAHRRSRSQ